MLMTAAGTVQPANVLVLGAGVAGLQAIATAKRLGAVVEAFDVRPAVKEQVESLGARFVEVPLSEEERRQAETAGGYAREMSDQYRARQAALIEIYKTEGEAGRSSGARRCARALALGRPGGVRVAPSKPCRAREPPPRAGPVEPATSGGRDGRSCGPRTRSTGGWPGPPADHSDRRRRTEQSRTCLVRCRPDRRLDPRCRPGGQRLEAGQRLVGRPTLCRHLR